MDIDKTDNTERPPEECAAGTRPHDLNQREEEIAALLEASRAGLRYREFESAARAIFGACKRLTGATVGYSALLTEDGIEDEVLFFDSGGVSCFVDTTLLVPARRLREEIYRTGKTVCENNLSDTAQTRFISQRHAGIDNVLFAPLLIQGIAVGHLGLANKPGSFTQDDARLASAFGEMLALALLNSRALESLQKSEESFRAVAQTASDAIITVDSQRDIVFWNRAAEMVFGYSRNGALGQPMSLIIPHRLRAIQLKNIERLVSTGKADLVAQTLELVGLRRDGDEFPMELSLSTWKSQGENFVTSIIRDVTKSRQMDEALRESEAQWRSLAESSPDNILTLDTDLTIQFANHASPGLTVEDLIGTPLYTYVAEDRRAEIKGILENVLRTGEPARYETEYETPDGTIYYDSRVVPWERAGDVIGLVLNARDITANRQAEELLKSQNQFITTVLEALNYPFYVIDANDYTLKMANSAAHSGELPEGIPCFALTHKRTHPCGGDGHPCPLELIKETKQPVMVEHAHYDREGNRNFYEVHGHPIFDDQGAITQIVEYTLDITERRRANEALRERTHELGERVKELNCLYGISALVEKPDISLPEILRGTANLIPPAWQFPEITGARITLDGQEFRTANLPDTITWQQAADIVVYDEPVGTVEVVYLEEKPAGDEGPFLMEERNLLNAIAQRLGMIAERTRAEVALRESEETARALLAAPTDVAALIDTNGVILGANETMAERINRPVAEIVGTCVWDLFPPDVVTSRKAKVEQVVRSSKPQRFEDWRQGIWNDNVLYPILDVDGEVSKIAVIARDVTARKLAEEVLQNAHDELELRVQDRTAALSKTNAELRAAALQNARLYEAELRARQTAETLSAASLALTQTLDLDKVTNTLLEFLEQLVPYDSAKIMMSRDERYFAVRAVRGCEHGTDPQELLGLAVDTQANPHIQVLLNTQKSFLVSDTRDHPEWTGDAAAEHTLSWLGVPLVAGDSVIGICGLEKTEPEFFTQEHVQLAEALVSQAAVAVQNAWLFQQVRAGRERLQSLSRRLVEVQESERRYIARELHDEASQALTSLKVGLRLLERDAQRPEAIVAGVSQLRDVADGVLENLHRLARDLRPASLDHLGLVAALRQYAEAISNQHGMAVQFEALGTIERLPSDVETALYRIVQEALTNVIRHAQATRADVLIERRGEQLIVLVEDNGIGFDPLTVVQSGHLGLFGMRERTEMLGGTLVVESAPDVRTTLLVEIPYADSDTHCG